MRRFASLIAIVAVTGAAAAAVLIGAAGATGAPPTTMPTITLTLTGTSVAVGGTTSSGAVNIVSTVTAKQAAPTLVRLNPGVTFAQAFAVVQAHRGDPNYLDPYGAIVFDAQANKGTSTAQTVLSPGHYVALDTQGSNPANWPRAEFDVRRNAHPAALPAASGSETAIEFGFRGSRTLHVGQMTRFANGGFLVHMVFGLRAKSHKAAEKVVKLLRAGKDRKLGPKLVNAFRGFAGPISSGAVQQFPLVARPGWWVLACFMSTQDGREHTRLGMERIIRIAR